MNYEDTALRWKSLHLSCILKSTEDISECVSSVSTRHSIGAHNKVNM